VRTCAVSRVKAPGHLLISDGACWPVAVSDGQNQLSAGSDGCK